MSSCSKVPEGPNTRTPATRIASLTCAGAALSAQHHAQTSDLSGPRGRHTRVVRVVGRSIEKCGTTVPAIGFPSPRREPSRRDIRARGRRPGIEAREVEPGGLGEQPGLHEVSGFPMQCGVVSRFDGGHGDELAVVAVGPGEISAGKARSSAVIGAAKTVVLLT